MAAKRKCADCAAAPATARPLWADPRVTLATSGFRFTRVVLTANVVTQLVAADATRVAVGFCADTPAAPITVSPDPNGNPTAWRIAIGREDRWFDVFTFGPLVPAAWYALSAGGVPVGVYEIYSLPGR